MMRAFSAGFLIKSDNKYLICRAFGGNENWGLPKGHVEDGETSFEAALRETYEETSLKLQDFHLDIDQYTHKHLAFKKKDVIIYFVEDTSGILIDQHLKCISFIDGDPSKPEIDKFLWVDEKDAKKMVSKNFKTLFTDMSWINKDRG